MAAGEERRRIAVLSRVGRVQRRLNIEVWLRALVAPLWVGVTVLVLAQVFSPFGLTAVVVGLVCVVSTVTVIQAWPRRISLREAAVVADRQAGSGGLLLTRLETPVGEWELGLNQQLKSLTMPKVRWRESGRWVLLAVLFAIAGFFVPKVQYPAKTLNAAAASRVDQLADKVEALAKEELMPEAIDNELARLQAELDRGAFDATDWEAADSLDQALNEKAASAAGDLSAAEQAAANLAKSLSQAQAIEKAAEDKAALEDALMKLGESPGSASPSQQPGETGKDGQPKKEPAPSTAASADALREALAKRREALAKSFGQKAGKGSPQPGTSASSKPGGSKGHGKGKGEKNGEGSGDGTGEGAGKGHASRGAKGGAGHGDAPPAELVFGEEAQMDPDRLKLEALPQGHGGDEPGELLGLRAANPTAHDPVPRSPATGASAAGAQAAGHREGPLLPRNRALIDRYFQSK